MERLKESKGCYNYKASEQQVYQRLFGNKGRIPLRVHINCEDLKDKKTFDKDHPEFYYAKLNNNHRFDPKQDECVIKKPINGQKDTLHYSEGGVIVGEKADILTSEQRKKLPFDERSSYTRGILRILGKEGRKDMANTKKYELFIPYPPEKQNIPWEQLPRILPEAIERFEQLADERTRVAEEGEQILNILPYHPLGTPRNPDNDPKGKLRLKTGDLVYFRAGFDHNNEVVITEVSFSSVWRARIETNHQENASVHHFFAKIDPELLPFNSKRNYVSPAELLFGFVQKETEKSTDKEKLAGLSFAGRVQVSFGLLKPNQSQPYYQEEVLLKSLLSPKPPCPIMYFKGQQEECITKSSLSLDKHRPQGRKMYLHRFPDDKRAQPWKTVAPQENRQLKTKIRPLNSETIFYFHLDFYNLTQWELGLLSYALRPCDTFRHKLGMGKPLGLGTVKIDPIGLFLIDREKRYRTQDIFNSPRYHQVWVEQDQVPAALYPQEYQATQQPMESAPYWQTLRDEFAKTMSPHIKTALELLGDPSKIPAVVHVPKEWIVKERAVGVEDVEIERENFKWFMENNGKQQLTPLSEKTEKIPTLER